MNMQLQKLLDLVRQTGDRLVVVDPSSDNIFVLMGLDQYKDLVQQDSALKPETKASSSTEPADQATPSNPKQSSPEKKAVRDSSNTPAALRRVIEQSQQADAPVDVKQLSEQERRQLRNALDEKKTADMQEKPSSSGSVSSPDEVDEEQFYLEPIE